MNPELIEKLLNQGEGIILDFKREQYRFTRATYIEKSELHLERTSIRRQATTSPLRRSFRNLMRQVGIADVPASSSCRTSKSYALYQMKSIQ